MNKPGQLLHAEPYDVQMSDGHAIESAFLVFDDAFGRRCRLYAAKCLPLDLKPGERRPAVLHLPGGGQTIFHADLVWWARQGFAAFQMDWQIGAAMVHGPERYSRWPEGVLNQGAAIERVEQAVLPLAIQGAGVVLDWMAQDPRVDANRAGVTGISWGGFLTWAVNAHETRFKAAAPVYGCGGLFRTEHAYKIGAKGVAAEVYRNEWDGDALGLRQNSPVCYLSSTNDFFGYHLTADALVSRLRVEHRRSSEPNNDHHLGPGESALGVAWFRHYLCDGPAVPREPRLREDLTVELDASSPVRKVEVWWSPTPGPEDMRCWLRSAVDPRVSALALARVHYESGITLNSPTVLLERETDPGVTMPAVWPDALDGVTSWWGMRSTQYYRTDIAVTPVPGDATRAEWAVARPGGGPLAVSFRGLADPRWNRGGFAALEIEIDPLGAKLDNPQVVADFVPQFDKRVQDTIPVTPTNVDGKLRFRVKPDDFPKRPEGAGWNELKQVTLIGQLQGNRFIYGPVRRVSE